MELISVTRVTAIILFIGTISTIVIAIADPGLADALTIGALEEVGQAARLPWPVLT